MMACSQIKTRTEGDCWTCNSNPNKRYIKPTITKLWKIVFFVLWRSQHTFIPGRSNWEPCVKFAEPMHLLLISFLVILPCTLIAQGCSFWQRVDEVRKLETERVRDRERDTEMEKKVRKRGLCTRSDSVCWRLGSDVSPHLTFFSLTIYSVWECKNS